MEPALREERESGRLTEQHRLDVIPLDVPGHRGSGAIRAGQRDPGPENRFYFEKSYRMWAEAHDVDLATNYDWFLKADDDTALFPQNFRRLLRVESGLLGPQV